MRGLPGVLLLLSFVLTAPAHAAEPAPAVLLVTIDTLRADHLSIHGFPLQTSPTIAALAERSVVFERAIASSGSTIPSHASIFTSRYVREHSVGHSNGRTALVALKTLAELFSAAGYDTGAFVSNAALERGRGLERGFDRYDDALPSYEKNRRIPERLAHQTTERAVAWLAERGEAPAFLWVHYQDPHGPYTPPPDLEDRFRVPPDRYEKALPLQQHNLGLDGIPAYQALSGLDRPSQYKGRYAGEIFHADASLAKLLAAFEARYPEALLLLTSDHGESFGENHRYLVHAYSTTPDIAHVPMLLKAPGLAPARRREAVSHVDVLPTLLELAGLAVPDDASGTALGPYLRGTPQPLPARWVYCDIGRELSAYRGEEFVRLHGVENAWVPGAELPSPLWVRHRWPRRTWTRTEAGEIDPAILAYAEKAVPVQRIDLAPGTVEMLQSLGYGD